MYQHKQKIGTGFTIVELLVVIVVIAILAAITIVAFNGITRQAGEAGLQSELRQAATAIGIDHATNASYPDDAASANGGNGLQSGPDNTLTYTKTDYGYCLSGVSSINGVSSYYVSNRSGSVRQGDCIPTVSTVAGDGTYGFLNGPVASAQFSGPYGVAYDSIGNLYVADCYDNRIRKISTDGVVSTFAGSGVAGATNATGTSASFSCPTDVVVDSDDNVYVADSYNDRIRMITQSQVVSTFASSAMVGSIEGLAIDAQDILYGASGVRIIRIDQSGTATLLAGSTGTTSGYQNATGSSARFFGANGIAISQTGDIYVADGNNHRIRKVTQTGVVTTFAGTGNLGASDGTTSTAEFGIPAGLTITQQGTMYVTDLYGNRVRVISTDGSVTTLAGSTFDFQDGPAPSALFRQPRGITLDQSGNLVIADIDNYRIRKITLP